MSVLLLLMGYSGLLFSLSSCGVYLALVAVTGEPAYLARLDWWRVLLLRMKLSLIIGGIGILCLLLALVVSQW